jgi:metal-responsive CopG/Arc/MetJ family transcriptional regulator
MEKTAKISISLPEDTLAAAEADRRKTGESRSEYFRRAVEALLERQREQLAVEKYLAGYRAQPESAKETEAAAAASLDAFAQEPWE